MRQFVAILVKPKYCRKCLRSYCHQYSTIINNKSLVNQPRNQFGGREFGEFHISTFTSMQNFNALISHELEAAFGWCKLNT